MKKALLVAVMLTACAGDGTEITIRPEEPTPSTDAAEAETVAPTEPEATPCCDDAPPVAETPVVSVPVVLTSRITPTRPLSEVQRAPSFYVDCFSELPRERRPCRAAFSRTLPEEHNLSNRELGDQELEDITVLVLARLCVSEANWIHDPRFDGSNDEQNHAERDCPAIYQVLRRTRRNGQTLLGIIRDHAHYVTEERTPRGARMRWIVNLQLDGDRPAHFPATDRNGNELNWDRDYRPRWEAMLEFVRGLLRGENLGVCAGAPIITWGGRCDDPEGACDDHLAERRGLVPYEACGDTANRFWCRPGTVGCAPAAEPVTEEPAVELDASAV